MDNSEAMANVDKTLSLETSAHWNGGIVAGATYSFVVGVLTGVVYQKKEKPRCQSGPLKIFGHTKNLLRRCVHVNQISSPSHSTSEISSTCPCGSGSCPFSQVGLGMALYTRCPIAPCVSPSSVLMCATTREPQLLSRHDRITLQKTLGGNSGAST